MQIDITLAKARVYNIDKVDIASGESFALNIVDPPSDKVRWFVENDPVLDAELSDNTFEFNATAKKPGLSTILIMSEEYAPIKLLTINVVSDITPIATRFDVEVGDPVKK